MLKLESLITELSARLSPETAATLQRLAQRPEVQAIVAEEDERLLDQRRALVAELDSLPAKNRAELEAAGRARNAAEQAHKDAQAAEFTARTKLLNATAYANGLLNRHTGDEASLRAMLVASADPRLQQTIDLAGSLFQIVRHLVVPSVTHHGRDYMGRPIVEWSSNVDQVNAALQAIQELRDECRSLQQQAVSRADVTAALDGMFIDVSALLAPLGSVPAPMLNEHGVPGLDFTGRTQSQVLEEAVRSVGGEPKEEPKPEPKRARGRGEGIAA